LATILAQKLTGTLTNTRNTSVLASCHSLNFQHLPNQPQFFCISSAFLNKRRNIAPIHISLKNFCTSKSGETKKEDSPQDQTPTSGSSQSQEEMKSNSQSPEETKSISGSPQPQEETKSNSDSSQSKDENKTNSGSQSQEDTNSTTDNTSKDGAQKEQQQGTTTPPKPRGWFTFENVSMVLVPSCLAGGGYWLWIKGNVKTMEDSMQDKIIANYPVDPSEVKALREANNITVQDVYSIMMEIGKKSSLQGYTLTFDEFEVFVQKILRRPLSRRYMLERIVRSVTLKENSKMDVKFFLLLLCMITNGSKEERKVLAFSILDSKKDGSISTDQFLFFVDSILKMGWCYDKRMYKKTQTYPYPNFELIKANELTETVLKEGKFLDGTISWDGFSKLTLYLM